MQKKFTDMTKQEAFETAVLGVVKQGALSRVGPKGSSCLYRGPNGLKCAVGHLIPDEDYDPEIEGKIATGDQPMSALGVEDAEEIIWLSVFQECHDEAESIGDFIALCTAFAARNGLKMPEGV